MMRRMNNLIAEQEKEQHLKMDNLTIPSMAKLKDLNEVANEANEIMYSYRASLALFKNRNSTQNKPVNLESTQSICTKLDEVDNQL